MISTLSILGAKGDTKLTWDPDDPEDCRRARETVAALKAAGYAFFLADNRPADEINGGGGGTLIVRKLTAEEVVPEAEAETVGPGPDPAEAPAEATADAPAPQPKRRGRPPKNAAQNVVAVRPVRGG